MTSGQPSTNPRLVKEADALVEAGHEVHVLCSHMVAWADESDRVLLSARPWTCAYVGGIRGSLLYQWTRLRHELVRKISWRWHADNWLGERALTRVTPELLAAATTYKADLYVAHYTGALLAAVRAAKKNGARVAFDAEDLESGYFEDKSGPQKVDRLVEDVERRYLPECCYVTAASPGIAAAYRAKYGIAAPVSILNVFYLLERPGEFRTYAGGGPMRLYWFSQTIGLGRGLEDVIQAMGRLRECNIELHLRGLARPDHWQQLQDLASANGVRPESIVLHPPLPPDQMIRAAADFDVGLALEQPLSVNRDICLTNKIFSYLLAGNAIAATATTGQRAIVERIGKAGFLYAPTDIDALAEGLRRWCQDREELQHARREAWSWGTREFNWDLEKKKFIKVVNAALSDREYAEHVC